MTKSLCNKLLKRLKKNGSSKIYKTAMFNTVKHGRILYD